MQNTPLLINYSTYSFSTSSTVTGCFHSTAHEAARVVAVEGVLQDGCFITFTFSVVARTAQDTHIQSPVSRSPVDHFRFVPCHKCDDSGWNDRGPSTTSQNMTWPKTCNRQFFLQNLFPNFIETDHWIKPLCCSPQLEEQHSCAGLEGLVCDDGFSVVESKNINKTILSGCTSLGTHRIKGLTVWNFTAVLWNKIAARGVA